MIIRIVVILGILLIPFSMMSFAQVAPDLGTTSQFVLFTAVGDYTNTGTTTITGDIGTNAGTYDDGFSLVAQTGTRYTPGDVTAEAAVDVLFAFTDFNKNTCDATQTNVTLGNGQTLLPGQYCYGDATPLEGMLTLDGNADQNSIFIIRIGGAFSAAALSQISLANGANWDNVYFQVAGALNVGAGAMLTGTFVASGAINLSEAAIFDGRMMTTAGAVNLASNVVTLPSSSLPVTLSAFTAMKGENFTTLLKWETTSETNSDRFEVQRSTTKKVWETIAVVSAAGESMKSTSYVFTDDSPIRGSNLYRLKMIDIDGTFSFSRIQNIDFPIVKSISGYPNPVRDWLTVTGKGTSQIERIQLNDLTGRPFFDLSKQILPETSTLIDVKSLPVGIYLIKLTLASGGTDYLRIVKE